MTKRDFIFLTIAPVILLAIAVDLLWLAARLHDGAERRLAEYTVLQERAAASGGSGGASHSSARAALTLSRLAVASHEADAATVTVSASLAALLLSVSLFQILTVVRLLRSQRKPASHPRPEIATGGGSHIRTPSGVTAVRSALSGVVDHTLP
jgi:hypothetical protein